MQTERIDYQNECPTNCRICWNVCKTAGGREFECLKFRKMERLSSGWRKERLKCDTTKRREGGSMDRSRFLNVALEVESGKNPGLLKNEVSKREIETGFAA